MPGTAVTKSVVASEPGGRKREEIFVDIIEKISVTFSSSVSISVFHTTRISPVVAMFVKNDYEATTLDLQHNMNNLVWYS